MNGNPNPFPFSVSNQALPLRPAWPQASFETAQVAPVVLAQVGRTVPHASPHLCSQVQHQQLAFVQQSPPQMLHAVPGYGQAQSTLQQPLVQMQPTTRVAGMPGMRTPPAQIPYRQREGPVPTVGYFDPHAPNAQEGRGTKRPADERSGGTEGRTSQRMRLSETPLPLQIAQAAMPTAQSQSFTVPARTPSHAGSSPLGMPWQPDASRETNMNTNTPAQRRPAPPSDVEQRLGFYQENPARITNAAMRTWRNDILSQVPLHTPEGLRRMFVLLQSLASLPRTAAFDLSLGDGVFNVFNHLMAQATVCERKQSAQWRDAKAFWADVLKEISQPEMASLRLAMLLRKDAELKPGHSVPDDIIVALHAPLTARPGPRLPVQAPSPVLSPQGGEYPSDDEEDASNS